MYKIHIAIVPPNDHYQTEQKGLGEKSYDDFSIKFNA